MTNHLIEWTTFAISLMFLWSLGKLSLFKIDSSYQEFLIVFISVHNYSNDINYNLVVQ